MKKKEKIRPIIDEFSYMYNEWKNENPKDKAKRHWEGYDLAEKSLRKRLDERCLALDTNLKKN